jgi:TolB protein
VVEDTATPTPEIPTETPTPTITPTPTPRPATIVYVQSSGTTHSLGLVSSGGSLLNADLHQRASAPTWDPANQRVAFYGEPGIAQGTGVWIINVPSGELKLLYAVDHIHNMSWSPDGSKLALEVGPPGVTHQIFVLDAETGMELSRFAGEQPTWGPKGQELVIKSCAPECGLWRVGFDGTSGRLLTPGSTDSYPTWSPDGQTIVYTSRAQTGDWEIYRLDLDSTTPVNLTNRAGSDTTPIFSPDGREIYFRTDAYGAWRVMAMALDGTNVRLVQDDVGASEDWGLARPAVK